MPGNKKINFWRLAFVFSAITILALVVSYGSYRGDQSMMMSGTMGDMMQMHLGEVTIQDLITQQEQAEVQYQTQTQDHSSHHGEGNSYIAAVHFLTTATIVLLLPFIVAGSVFLAIIWLK